MSPRFVTEYTGNGDLLGVIWCASPHDPPEYAYVDDFDRVNTERFLGPTVTGPTFTWYDVLHKLVIDQNVLTVIRDGPRETTKSAADVLTDAINGHAHRHPLVDVDHANGLG